MDVYQAALAERSANALHTRELTAKGAKDAKAATIEALGFLPKIEGQATLSFVLENRFFYFAPLASFAVKLYRAQMPQSIRGRATRLTPPRISAPDKRKASVLSAEKPV